VSSGPVRLKTTTVYGCNALRGGLQERVDRPLGRLSPVTRTSEPVFALNTGAGIPVLSGARGLHFPA